MPASTMSARAVLVALAFLSFTGACQRATPAGVGGGAALMTNLGRARELEIVAQEHALFEPLERAAALVRIADPAVRFDAHVVDGSSSSQAGVPRIVVGTRDSGTAQALVARAGVQAVGDEAHPAFTYAGQEFGDAHDAVIATFEDPDRPGLPVTVVFGNQASVALRFCASLQPAWKPWVRVLRAGDVVLTGPIDLDGAARTRDLARPGVARREREGRLESASTSSPGLTLRASPGLAPDAVTSYVAACGAARARVALWCTPGAEPPTQMLVLWSHPEDYLADGDPDALSRYDPVDGRVDALVFGPLSDGGAAVARAGACASLGEPSAPWMHDAAGVEAAWVWWGKSLDTWLRRTSAAGRDLSIARLVSPRTGEEVSTHVLAPRRAALWRFLRETRGDLLVRELWRGTRGLETLGDLDATFEAWLAARLAAAPLDHQGGHAPVRVEDFDARPMRGVATCPGRPDDPGGPGRGYGTRAFEVGLDTARAGVADALLVSSFTRDQPGFAPLFGVTKWRTLAPREGDVRLVVALLAGSERGMRTLLAPHLVSGDGGTWTGIWSRSDQASWRNFFERYARFVEHHALVAEIGGAEVLSIGAGLAAVTSVSALDRRSNPAELEWKRTGWSRVIAGARGSFSGLLTYSAGSVGELASVLFFGDLDCVGFELAPVLADRAVWNGPDARDEIGRWVDSSLSTLERVARANGKRILLTQVCFSPGTHGAASEPGTRSASRDWQAQQFRDFSERLRAWSGRSSLAGLFAWRLSDGVEADEYDPVIVTAPVCNAVRELLQSL